MERFLILALISLAVIFGVPLMIYAARRKSGRRKGS
jgi:hypothetical protein